MLIVHYVAKTPNPSINPDWRDKAAPSGYVTRWAAQSAIAYKIP